MVREPDEFGAGQLGDLAVPVDKVRVVSVEPAARFGGWHDVDRSVGERRDRPEVEPVSEPIRDIGVASVVRSAHTAPRARGPIWAIN